MMYIYLGIVALLLIAVLDYMFREKHLFAQIDAALVIVPLVLRILLIK